MSDEKKFDIHLQEGQTTLNILEGTYRHEEITKQKISLSGTITAPGLHVDHLRKNDKLDMFTTLVTIDMDNLTIRYDGDPREKYGDYVSGKLEFDTFLKSIGINTEKRHNLEQLKLFVKRNRIVFASETQHAELLNAITSFKLKLQREIENKNDDRGNKSVSDKSVLDTELPFSFDLKLPIFKGALPVIFRVDVLLEVVGNGVQFWLDSTELKEQIDIQKVDIMEAELKKFDGLNVIFI